MADEDPNIDKTPPEDKPVSQPPPAIRKPEVADVPPNTQYQGPSQADIDKAQQNVTEAQEMLKQQQEDIKRWSAREEDFQNQYRAGMQQIQAEITKADKDRATPPDLLPMNQRPEADLHAQNHLQWSWPNALFTLGVLALGAAGKGHSSVLSNYFLGSFFQAYAAGQQERAKEMELGWHQQNEAIYRENELRINEYRAKLSDERLSLDSKIQLMKNLADQYKDPAMTKALMTNNLNNVRTQLNSYDKSLHDLREAQQKAFTAQQHLMKQGSKNIQNYDEQAAAVFEQKYGHRPLDQAEWSQARKDYKLYDYFKNKKAFGTDIKGEPQDAPGVSPTPTPGASPSATPSATPTDDELERSIRLFENKQRPQ